MLAYNSTLYVTNWSTFSCFIHFKLTFENILKLSMFYHFRIASKNILIELSLFIHSKTEVSSQSALGESFTKGQADDIEFFINDS